MFVVLLGYDPQPRGLNSRKTRIGLRGPAARRFPCLNVGTLNVTVSQSVIPNNPIIARTRAGSVGPADLGASVVPKKNGARLDGSDLNQMKEQEARGRRHPAEPVLC